MKFKYYTCDVFTEKRFGGNQLAVFPSAEHIPEKFLPAITKEFNFSETAFIYPPQNTAHTKRVRIFTPGAELPFAGHPTIGAAFVLAAIGEISLEAEETTIVLEEGVGSVPVKIISKNRTPEFLQLTAAKRPEFFSAPDGKAIMEFLSLSANDWNDNYPVQIVSCGVPFLFVSVTSLEALRRISVNVQKLDQTLRNYSSQDVFVFAEQEEQSHVDFRVRMFAPVMGIPEDPATGSAAASFAGYLAQQNSLYNGTLQWKIEQGIEMGRPSQLFLEAEKANGTISATRVGGSAVLVCEGILEI
ncbi:MAG: PhzF family phenazine biosynthesis protein [Bacteroidetes bacterium]|nr:PhzF family phenazine biosynthesis protein [Bacteroidota bacterium]